MLHFLYLEGGAINSVEIKYSKCKKDKEFVTNEKNLLVFKHSFNIFSIFWY